MALIEMEVYVNIHLYNYVLILVFLSVYKSLILENLFTSYVNFVHNIERGFKF